MDIQEACEIIEELLDRDAKSNVLNIEEFKAVNVMLLELQIARKYIMPEKYK